MKSEVDNDYYMSQEFYNEIMSEADAEEDLRIAEDKRVNDRIFKALISVKGKRFVSNLKKDLKENECDGGLKFSNRPKGEKQSNYWGNINGVYVDQYTGYECDDYYGWIYFPIKNGKWLKCHYAC